MVLGKQFDDRDKLAQCKLLDNLVRATQKKEPTLFRQLQKIQEQGSDPGALIDCLVNSLDDHRIAGVRDAAAWSLGFFGRLAPQFQGNPTPEIEKVLAALQRAMKSRSNKVREQAVLALRDFSWFAPVLVAQALIGAITKPKERATIVEHAIDGLWNCGLDAAAEAVPILGSLLMKPSANIMVRLKACAALQWFGQEPDAVDALASIVIAGGVKPEDRRVRIEAVKALEWARCSLSRSSQCGP